MYDPNFPPPTTPTEFTPPPPAATNGVGKVALYCGIGSVFTMIFNWVPVQWLSLISCLAPILGIAALITGIMGLNFAKKNNGAGRGGALAGLIMGSVILAIYLLLVGIGFVIGFSQALG